MACRPVAIRTAMKRKIAAILAADIAGFSKLVAEDEEGALERLGVARDHFVTTIDQFGGRVFNEAGDSILAEFASAVDALRCAVEVQQHFRNEAREEPSERRMLYRIGLTIGDVVERDGNLLGDAINVAARLESLAKPGGICISRSVHEHVSGKIAVRFLSLGEQKLKNIPTRQHAWEVILPQKKPDKADAAARALDPPPITAGSGGASSPAFKRVAAGLVILAGAGLAAWALPWSHLSALIDKPASTVAAPTVTPSPAPQQVAVTQPAATPAPAAPAPAPKAPATTAPVEAPASKPAPTAAPPPKAAATPSPALSPSLPATAPTPAEAPKPAPLPTKSGEPKSDPPAAKSPEAPAKVASTAPIVPTTPRTVAPKSGDCSTFLPQTGTTISVPCPDAPAAAAPAPSATEPAKPAARPAAVPAAPQTVVIALPTRRPADLSAPTPVVQPAAATPVEPAKSETSRQAPRRKGQLCAEVLERAQLGELSIDDKEYLQRECR